MENFLTFSTKVTFRTLRTQPRHTYGGLQWHKGTPDGDCVHDSVSCELGETQPRLFCSQSLDKAAILNLHDISCVQRDLIYVWILTHIDGTWSQLLGCVSVIIKQIKLYHEKPQFARYLNIIYCFFIKFHSFKCTHVPAKNWDFNICFHYRLHITHTQSC